MIENDEQLNQTRLALADLESSLAALKRDVYLLNSQRFALMAEPIVDHISELRGQIDEYVGVNAAITETAPIWMRLKGEEIELGDAPTSIITKMLDTLRRGVQTVAEFLEKGVVSTRPTAAIKQACDLRIVAWMPGSVQVGLRLPEVDLEEVGEEAQKALGLYLRAATWVGSEDDSANLESDLPDPHQRRLLLSQVERLVPRPQGSVESVELFGRGMPRGPVKLKRESRARVRQAIERTVKESLVVQEELVTVQGILREIDLDQRTFIIRNPEAPTPSETRCSIPPESSDLLEIARDGLDHEVVVVGNRQIDPTKRQSHPLRVHEIEVLGKPSEEYLSEPVASKS